MCGVGGRGVSGKSNWSENLIRIWKIQMAGIKFQKMKRNAS